MTFEEMERTMQFILEQQAQLTVKHAEAEERTTRLEAAQEAAARQIEHLATTTAERIENLAATTARQIDHLGAALVELTEAHTRTQGALDRLAEAQAHGERRLDVLIDVVRGLKDGGS
jgi:chromosome segregation ATPase